MSERVPLAPWTRLPTFKACYAVATPYREAFVLALKSKFPEWGCCRFTGPLAIWTVVSTHLTELASLLLEHFPKEERCQTCFDGRPCSVWREKDRKARELKLGRLRDLPQSR